MLRPAGLLVLLYRSDLETNLRPTSTLSPELSPDRSPGSGVGYHYTAFILGVMPWPDLHRLDCRLYTLHHAPLLQLIHHVAGLRGGRKEHKTRAGATASIDRVGSAYICEFLFTCRKSLRLAHLLGPGRTPAPGGEARPGLEAQPWHALRSGPWSAVRPASVTARLAEKLFP